MYNEQTIQFKKQRELGEILTDTFKFIRENYKLLLSYIFKTTGPFFLILVIAVGYYTYSVAGNTFASPFESGIGNFIISFLILIGALLLFYSALYGTILHYIKLYISNDGKVPETEVKAGVQKDFLNFFFFHLYQGYLSLPA
jgi:succinate dehydrogenase/fumarate reductase cytochrome b subunit